MPTHILPSYGTGPINTALSAHGRLPVLDKLRSIVLNFFESVAKKTSVTSWL
jgi:hypothetical protein